MMLQPNGPMPMEQPTPDGGEAAKVAELEALGGTGDQESSVTKNARQRVAESTAP